MSLSKRASVVKGALMVFLRPRLAQDAKLDLSPMLEGLTNANYRQRKLKLAQDIEAQLWRGGMLARDQHVRELPQLLNALETVEEPEDQDMDESVIDFLATRLSPSDLAAFKRLCGIGGLDDEPTGKPRGSMAERLTAEDRVKRFTTAQDGFLARHPDARRIDVV